MSDNVDKITKIRDFIQSHTQSLNLPENEDVEPLTPEEEAKFYAVIDKKIEVLFGKRKPDENDKQVFFTPGVCFDLQILHDLIIKDSDIKHDPKWMGNLNKMLNNYGRGKHKYIVSVGDPALKIYTTKSQLDLEIDTLNYVNYKFPNASVKADLRYINAELEKTTQQYNEIKKVMETVQKYGRMSQEQKNGVFACTLTDSMVSVLEGFAGAGKSFTMGAVSGIYRAMGYNVMGVTLSNKAAQVLESESKMPCTSVADILQQLKKRKNANAAIFDIPTVIIVDEAGLVGLNQFNELMSLVTESPVPVKIILAGDSTQLNPIMDANSLELAVEVIDDTSKAVITEIRRQRSKSHIQAVLNFKDGNAGKGLYTYLQQEAIHICDNKPKLVSTVLSKCFNDLISDPYITAQILCQDNKLVGEFNYEYRKILKMFGRVEDNDSNIVMINQKNSSQPKAVPMSKGDQVVFTANFKNIKLYDKETNNLYKGTYIMNKMSGTILDIKGNPNDGYDMTVEITMADDEYKNNKAITIAKFNTKRDLIVPYTRGAGIDLNYALTVYSSQGQTVDKIYCVDSSLFDCRNAYVGASRHRLMMEIFVNREDIAQRVFKSQNRAKRGDGDNEVKYLSALDILNEVGRVWSKNNTQHSVIITAMDEYKKLNNLAIQNRIPLDFNKLNEGLLDLKKELEEEHKSVLRTKGMVQELDDNKAMDLILDAAEFFINKPPKLDYKKMNHELEKSKLEELNNPFSNKNNSDRPDGINLDIIHLEKEKGYKLHPMITEEFFHQYENKLVAIGRGSEIRFVARSEEGNVYSKYDIFGNDGLGIGYPVMAHDGVASHNSEIYVIEDLNLYLDYLKHFYLDVNNEIDKPILIWGARTTDYSHVINSFENKKIHLIGSEAFKYNSFFRMTHAVGGLELNAEFVNIDENVVNLYRPEAIEGGVYSTPEHKMPVNHLKFGEYCRDNALKNIKYSQNLWDFVLDGVSKNDFQDKLTFDVENASSFVNELGVLPMSFVKDYVVNKKQLMDEKRFNDEVLPRCQRIEEFKFQKNNQQEMVNFYNMSQNKSIPPLDNPIKTNTVKPSIAEAIDDPEHFIKHGKPIGNQIVILPDAPTSNTVSNQTNISQLNSGSDNASKNSNTDANNSFTSMYAQPQAQLQQSSQSSNLNDIYESQTPTPNHSHDDLFEQPTPPNVGQSSFKNLFGR